MSKGVRILEKPQGFLFGTVTQTGTDTNTWIQYPTGIDAGAKMAMRVVSLEVYWSNAKSAGGAAGTTDFSFWVMCGRSPVVASYINPDVFGFESVSVSKGGIAQTTTEGVYGFVLPDSFLIDTSETLTVQPWLYVGVGSASTSQANAIDFRVGYVMDKLTEAEYLRLLAGGV